MQSIDGQLVYSATDLVGFMECRHLAHLDRAAAAGLVERPMRVDRVLERIAKRGIEHEQRFLREIGPDVAVVEIAQDRNLPYGARLAVLKRRRDETIEAMRAGAEVIYQAVLFDGRRLGYADFLQRVETPTNLGAWGYEVWDTKLARKPKASAVLQIAMYSEMVGVIQGQPPELMHLALGGVKQEKVSYRVADFAAYARSVVRDFEALLNAGAPTFPVLSDPEPVEHCDICAWSEVCRKRWREQDDLSLVAGLTSKQRRSLREIEVATRTGLAEPATGLPERIEGIGRDALARVRAQARIQVEGERQGAYLAERIPPQRDRDGVLEPGRGLLMLPEPSRGDLFFDMEGDPFFGSDEVDGLDYLFGVIEPGRLDDAGEPTFHAFWATEERPEGGKTVTTAGERRAFEAFIDLVMDRLRADPALHVYHYAPYETTAVKRLASRYATREAEVDQLLRGHVFVDLYRAVRQGVRASVESYSIKKLEPFYGYTRHVDLRDAGSSIVEFETWLELGGAEDSVRGEELLQEIAGYNRDDCLSTWHLRDWLEGHRTQLEQDLRESLARPIPIEAPALESSGAQQAEQALADAIMAGLPADLGEHPESFRDDERGRWLLAQLLQYYRREERAFWWRYFDLLENFTDEQRVEESDALGMIAYVDSWRDPKAGSHSNIHRFRFPPQDHKLRVGDTPRDQDGKPAGTVFAIDEDARTIDLRAGTKVPAPAGATSLIPYNHLPSRPKPESLRWLGQWVVDHGLDGAGPYRAVRDLLMRRPPRAGQVGGSPLAVEGEDVQAAARRLVLALDASYLAIQGPPGSGKSSVGGEMIVGLVAAGKRVGVTGPSHKVIAELLAKVGEAAEEAGAHVRIGQRTSGDSAAYPGATAYAEARNATAALRAGEVDVLGATAWQWAREDMRESVDVLFLDEAGQFALADAVAVGPAATNLVLLGDPQQLDQVLQGAHPKGAERSALGHLLGGERVMPGTLGLFLDGTWRLHPRITAYTSEVFYEGRLHSHPGREALDLSGVAPLDGTGIRFIPAEHAGYSSESPPEAEAIAAHLQALLRATPTWTDAGGKRRTLTSADVLLITPYNAQVAELARRLPGLRIGTVDKFQGQQAPVAVYSMATSSAEEAPRGMEFLYSLNRLNVATSRAQCLAVVVASPTLLQVRCKTPRQMQLVNALARLVEVASDSPAR